MNKSEKYSMQNNEIIAVLESNLKPSSLRYSECMGPHTSFRIGGAADVYVSPESLDEIICTVKIAKDMGVPLKVFGNGTNILVSDEGLRCIVLDCKRAVNDINFNGKRVDVGAGALLKTFSEKAADEGLSGVEQAVGIPGTVGGALIMNAGANGYNIGNLVESVTVLSMDGKIEVLKKGELSFNYRHSSLKNEDYIILQTELMLENGNKELICKVMSDEIENRNRKFPLEYPNAGSIFKRPKEGYPGKWVEMAGCKGMSVGGAEVSMKHANFIINKDNAKAKDVLCLIDKVQEAVLKKFKILLEKEIIFWGDETAGV